MINKIHTFGTSFTAGGGFEFGSKERNHFLTEIYKDVDLPKNQYSFSWPGQLQHFLTDNKLNIEVINHAKQGYGNEMLYRKVFDVVSDKNFQRNKELLLLEFSHMMRKEFFFRPLNDYIVCNYHFEDKNGELLLNGPDMAHSYYYDSEETTKLLDENAETFHQFFKLTMEENDILKKINQNITLMLSFLDKNKIKYLTTSSPLIEPTLFRFLDYGEEHKIYYQKEDFITEFLEKIVIDGKMQIKSETNGEYDDFHAGYQGNREIAKMVYNNLISKGFISTKELVTDFNFKQFNSSRLV